MTGTIEIGVHDLETIIAEVKNVKMAVAMPAVERVKRAVEEKPRQNMIAVFNKNHLKPPLLLLSFYSFCHNEEYNIGSEILFENETGLINPRLAKEFQKKTFADERTEIKYNKDGFKADYQIVSKGGYLRTLSSHGFPFSQFEKHFENIVVITEAIMNRFYEGCKENCNYDLHIRPKDSKVIDFRNGSKGDAE